MHTGDAINYAGMLEGDGYRAVNAMVQGAAKLGYVTSERVADSAPWFGTLDIYDTRGDIIQDFTIPSADAWQWWHDSAVMRPTDWDCDTCDVR